MRTWIIAARVAHAPSRVAVDALVNRTGCAAAQVFNTRGCRTRGAFGGTRGRVRSPKI